MKKNNIILMVIAVATLLSFVIFATYAYYVASSTATNAGNVNASSESNNMVFETMGGEMSLNVTLSNMAQINAGNVAAENNTTLTVNFTANTPYSMVCSYDIVYEWTSSDKYTAHSSGVTTSEFTIKAILEDSAHVYVGNNKINFDNDLTSAVGNNNSATVVTGAQIDGSGSTTSSAVWNLESKFFNVDANQSALSGKTYAGKFKVENVSCVAGTVKKIGNFNTYWFALTSNRTFPATGGPVHTSGPSTGQRVYIAQDSTRYYACAYFPTYEKEVCLSYPYTQYGLEGHVLNQNLTSEQKESGSAAILEVFNNAGINITSSSCPLSNNSVSCIVDNIQCYSSIYGNVGCLDLSSTLRCRLSSTGKATCI